MSEVNTRHEVRVDRQRQVAELAAKAFAGHGVEVKHEDGLYRHYRCARPGTGNYCFHVVTFPGRLVVCGDMGDMAWERCPDMLEWATDAIESTGYFAEKCWGSLKVREWSEDVARAAVDEQYRGRVADWAGDDTPAAADAREKLSEVRAELLSAVTDGHHAYVEAYYGSDWYDGDFPTVDDYTSDFLWCREAVRWFLANRTPPSSSAASAEPAAA